MNTKAMKLLSPAAIKYYRKVVKKWTQQYLADSAMISRKTITAIENADSEEVRVHSAVYSNLMGALGITPYQIIGKELKDDDRIMANQISLEDEEFFGDSFEAWIDEFSKRRLTGDNFKTPFPSLEKNFRKVCDTYNVSITDILHLAPLLFADFAEKCLEKEMREFSEQHNNQRETRGAKYILRNIFGNFIKEIKNYDPSNNHHDYLEALEKEGRILDSLDGIPDLKNDIDRSLREKDVCLNRLHKSFILSMEEWKEANPLTKHIKKLLDKKGIRENFMEEFFNIGSEDNKSPHFFDYSGVIQYSPVKARKTINQQKRKQLKKSKKKVKSERSRTEDKNQP